MNLSSEATYSRLQNHLQMNKWEPKDPEKQPPREHEAACERAQSIGHKEHSGQPQARAGHPTPQDRSPKAVQGGPGLLYRGQGVPVAHRGVPLSLLSAPLGEALPGPPSSRVKSGKCEGKATPTPSVEGRAGA